MKKLILILMAISLFAIDFTFTKAYRAFNQGIRLEKTNPQMANKKFYEAYILLQQVIQKKPSSQAFYMLGRIYCNGWGVDKDYKKAEEMFLKALKLGNRRVNCCLARLYIRMNQKDKAKKYLEYALSHQEIANYCNDIDPQQLKEKQ
jgi:TPR repeat protein